MSRRIIMRLMGVTLVGALTSMLAACSAPGVSTAAATPTVDSVTKAYLGVLRSAYVPWANLETQLSNECYIALESLQEAKPQPEKQQAVLTDCKPKEAAALASTKALLNTLSAATPPARWQAQADSLAKGLQAYLAYHAKQALAIEANDVAQYLHNTVDTVTATLDDICPLISAFNAGPPELDPPLPIPPGHCGSGSS